MSKGSWKRPYSQQRWAKGWDRTFRPCSCHLCGATCHLCGATLRLHEARPAPGARGDETVLCTQCRKEADREE